MKTVLVSVKQEGVEFPTSTPLGLVSVATYLRERCDVGDVSIADLNFCDPGEIIRRKPDIVGISAMTVDYGRAIELARYVKERLDVPVVVGGVHISTLPSSLDSIFDAGIVGEGEKTAKELLEEYAGRGSFEADRLQSIRGLVYWKRGTPKVSEPRPLIGDLDELPIPDMELMPAEYFKPRVLFYQNRVVPQAHIMTSRGCPYKCVFCSTAKFWCTVRFHGAHHVIDQIAQLHERYDIRHFHVEDDLFTVNLPRMEEIRKGLQEEDILDEVTFSCQPRANLVNDRVCDMLTSLNVKTVGFGFESGSERILDYLKAGSVTVEQNKQAVKLCRKYGFNVTGSLIFGSPGEKIADMQKTLKFIDFLREAGAANVWCFVMTPFPGTEIWEEAKRRGKVADDMDWTLLSNYNESNPLLLDDDIPLETFQKILSEAHEKTDRMGSREQWRNLISLRLRQNPLGVLKLALAQPDKALRYLGKGI